MRAIDIIIYIYFFLKNNENFQLNLGNSYLNNLPTWRKKFSATFFILPPRKRTIIFLRAPYKNKLARLNILRRQYSLIFSIKLVKNDKKYLSLKSVSELNNLLVSMASYNWSTLMLKHSKTRLVLDVSIEQNYTLRNFI